MMKAAALTLLVFSAALLWATSCSRNRGAILVPMGGEFRYKTLASLRPIWVQASLGAASDNAALSVDTEGLAERVMTALRKCGVPLRSPESEPLPMLNARVNVRAGQGTLIYSISIELWEEVGVTRGGAQESLNVNTWSETALGSVQATRAGELNRRLGLELDPMAAAFCSEYRRARSEGPS